jgi:molecular chaperone GrpE
MQRSRADFLNAKRRLEEEKKRDYGRTVAKVIGDILPLCDSFELAMRNKGSWEKADEVWRKGVEGIYAQLQGILTQYNVITIDPSGEVFNPHEHEALSIETVTDKTLHDTVINTVQKGYQLTHKDGTTEMIRPPRVTIGTLAE